MKSYWIAFTAIIAAALAYAQAYRSASPGVAHTRAIGKPQF